MEDHVKEEELVVEEPEVKLVESRRVAVQRSTKELFERYKFWVAIGAIVLFVIMTSAINSMLLPPQLDMISRGLLVIKILLAAIVIVSAIRVKRRRDKEFAHKIAKGKLWEGPIEPDALRINMGVLEIIRYHFDHRETFEKLDRKHWFSLVSNDTENEVEDEDKKEHWYTKYDSFAFHVMAIIALIALTVLLAMYAPPVDFYFDSPPLWEEQLGIRDTPVYFTYWWVPTIFILFFFYEALRNWQDWKWDVRGVSQMYVTLMREQSTYMPWTGLRFRSIPVHQIIGARLFSPSKTASTVGWDTVELTVRADEADDKPEKIRIDFVREGNRFLEDLMRVLPAFRFVDEKEKGTDKVHIVIDEPLPQEPSEPEVPTLESEAVPNGAEK